MSEAEFCPKSKLQAFHDARPDERGWTCLKQFRLEAVLGKDSIERGQAITKQLRLELRKSLLNEAGHCPKISD